MVRHFSIALVLLLAVPLLAASEEGPLHAREGGGPLRHFLITTDHVLTPGELAGVEVQHTLPAHRYIVRASDAEALKTARGVRSVEAYAGREKMTREGLRAAASSSPFVSINVLFHDDTTFDAAQAAVEAAGGTIETPFAIAATSPQRLQVRIPPGSIGKLAQSETVFGIYGRPLRPVAVNDLAARLSSVPAVNDAPYNLDGTDIVLSQFEPDDGSGSGVDTAHTEFSGRVTTHNTSAVGRHATHVAGTMIARGANAAAKGMAPNAKLEEFDLSGQAAQILTSKRDLGALGVTSDNNSWGFVLAWQQDSGAIRWVWNGGFDYYGNYDALYSAPYDKIAIDPAVNVLYVHSAGNDGANGHPNLDENGRHRHVADKDGSVLEDEIFCYSKNGSGTDCPTPTCSPGNSIKSTEDDGSVASHCEVIKHPTYDAYGTISFIASEKNVMAVGACDSAGNIAAFSARGPAKDGRVKPELMAMGVGQFSTLPDGTYGSSSGTSMSSPVVTGIAALVAQQWKQTFNARPTAQQIKTLLIAGARDRVGDISVDLPGPDYSYGYGVADAKGSVDIIRADGNTGSHIRTNQIGNGQTVEIPLTVSASGNFRAVLAWADPEVVLPPPSQTEDPIADQALVNDLDLKIIDPSGSTVFPYVLDKDHPTVAATRGVNAVDNTEVVEIANAAPGSYRAVISGKSVPVNAPQTYVFVTTLANVAPPCTDSLEPNDTPQKATAISNGQAVHASACANDTDWFTFTTNRSGPITVMVTTKDTPVTVELDAPGPTAVKSTVVPANTTFPVSGTIGSGSNLIVAPAQTWFVKVTPSGTPTGDSSYTLSTTFPPPNLGRAPGRRGH